MLGLIIIVVAFAFIYLVLLRPQRRQRTEQAQMWETLEVGDEVVTAGGIYGEITGFEGDDLLVEIAPDIEVRVARRAIGGVIRPEPGELEEESEAGDEASIAEDESYSEESR